MKEIQYLYEDEDILVVCKPAGMATENKGTGRSAAAMDLVSALRSHLVRARRKEMRAGGSLGRSPRTDESGISKAIARQNIPGRSLEGSATLQPPYLAMIHRLDQPVEGVLVFAKNKEAAASLSKQLQDHTMQKEYLAVVQGVPENLEGRLEDYILHDKKTGAAEIVDEGTEGAKKAVLDYKVLETRDDCSLVHVILHTGRFHQIRLQLAGIGTPILGDVRHGAQLERESNLANADSAAEKNLSVREQRMFISLCSYRLTFRHPRTKRMATYQIAPSDQAFGIFDNFKLEE